LFRSEHEQPMGIGLVHPAFHEKDLPNPCANNTCSHLCVISAKEHSHGHVFASCLCPTDYEFLPNTNDTECVPVAEPTKNITARWCTDAFVSACEVGKACVNGKCVVEKDDHGQTIGAHCDCPPNYEGDYCEVKGSHGTSSNSKNQERGSGWWPALLIFLTFVILTCGILILLCRYGKYRQKIPSLRWSPSVIFRKTVLMARGGNDFEQRQRIISTNEDGSKGLLGKNDSFANPVYEEVQVPVHQTYTIFKRENSSQSHDSDADSGFEINASNGSP